MINESENSKHAVFWLISFYTIYHNKHIKHNVIHVIVYAKYDKVIPVCHSGSMSTGHANSPEDMLSRIETMVLMGMDLPLAAVRGQIASAIDIIVHLGRLRDRSRKVLEVSEVKGMEEGAVKLNTLFRFRETGEEHGSIQGKLEKCAPLIHEDKLREAGISPGTV